MAEYQLYCFAQSGNAYRAALMLNLIGADWQPVYVDQVKHQRQGIAPRSMKWVKRRYWCTARRSSVNPG